MTVRVHDHPDEGYRTVSFDWIDPADHAEVARITGRPLQSIKDMVRTMVEGGSPVTPDECPICGWRDADDA